MMKDLYSFHTDENDLGVFYKKAEAAYRRIFARCGLKIFITEASGGTFTKNYSHEFQVLSEAGEDWLLYCAKCGYAQNKEISKMGVGHKCPKCSGTIEQGRSIEAGNIFKLGTKFSDAFGLFYADARGVKNPVVMGSYGIGPGRLLGTIVEVHADAKGILWPDEVAPFEIHLIELLPREGGGRAKVKKAAEKLYKDLIAKGATVLYDEREEKTAGEKFADADLIGIPWRVVVSERTLEKKSVEVKRRDAEAPILLKLTQFNAFIKKELLG